MLAGLLVATPLLAANSQSMYRQALNRSSQQSLAAQLDLGVKASLKARAAAPTARGTTTVRMQQLYHGVPVYGRSVAVERDGAGQAIRVTGALSRQLDADIISTVPRLNSSQALDVLEGATRRNPARLKLRPRPGLQPGSNMTQLAPLQRGEAKLYVYPQSTGGARLVYLASYVEYGPTPTRPTAIIDADSGEIIKQWDGLTTHNATGPGGNTKTGQYVYGSGGRDYLDVTKQGSTCYMSNAHVHTYDMNNSTYGSGTLWSFPCSYSSGDSVNGAYSPINDAHHFGNVVYDMYQAWLGVPPLSFDLVMRVHYGSNFQNAYWDGSQMTFGDGGSTFYPLAVLDVTGHEISHGFTEQHSGLAYTGQSGGINEAFSDMAGEAVEYFDSGSNDWVVGADATKGSSPLRWMCTPTYDGGSIGSANDYYSGLDVHYSSGVYNKAFCTLAKSSGWNTKTAFQVFARANALYWTASTNFDSGACGVESAAADYGYDVADVTAAFVAVDVDCPSSNGGGNPGGGSTGGALDNGVVVDLAAVGSGSFSGDYTVAIPAGATNLQIAIGGGSGDADLYVRYGAAPTTNSFDCRPYESGNSEQCSFASPAAGTWHVKVRAYQSFANVQLVASWDTNGGNGGGNDGSGVYDNAADIAIPDGGSTSSSVNVSGEGSSGPSNLQVHVQIVHSYSGDLRITLIAPGGGSVVLKDPDYYDGSNNVNQTWSVDASSVNPNGTWTLKVDDVYGGYSGYIDDFRLTF